MPITIKTNGMAFKDSGGTYKQFDSIKGDTLPSGGQTGQVLKKKSDQTGDVEWGSAGISYDVVVSGGNPIELDTLSTIDVNRLLAQTYVYNGAMSSPYMATENCVVIGNTTGTFHTMKIDGKIPTNGRNNDYFGNSFCIYLKKGQTFQIIANANGDIFVYGIK